MIFPVVWLASCLCLSAGASSPGLTIRVWNIQVSPHDLPTLQPGERPNDIAVVPTLDLTTSADFLGHEDTFYLLADADLQISEPGVYEFQLNSDDGSELWIAGTRVIDNGGLHSAERAEGRISLDAGRHPIQVKFFQGTMDAVLQLSWKTPRQTVFSIVPESVLTTNLPDDLPTSPGPKSIVRDRSPRLPGHGSKLEGLHAGMDSWQAALPGLDGHVTGMAVSADGSLLLLSDRGSLWRIVIPDSNQDGVDMTRVAEGLDDPGGLVVDTDGIWVIQKEELTRLRDLDDDGVVDEYIVMATGWPVVGHDDGKTRGLQPLGDDFLTMLTRSSDHASEHRGTMMRIARDGSWDILGDGLLSPIAFSNGTGLGPVIIDQDASVGIVPLLTGVDDLSAQGVRLPDGALPNSAMWLDGGTWKNQLLVVDGAGHGMRRVAFDRHDNGIQGACFRVSQGLGNIDHIMGGSDNHVILVSHDEAGARINRLNMNHHLFQMQSIEAYENGLMITFSDPVDPLVASDPSAWFIVERPMDGSSDQAASRRLLVDQATVLAGDRSVFIEMDDLRSESLIHMQLVGPWSNQVGQLLHSNEAWYTMHQVPGRTRTPDHATRTDGHNRLTPMQEAQGWTLLFDGESMDLWRGFGKDHFPDEWTIRDGQLIRTRPSGDIITREQFDDFELSLDWKVEPGGNSGVFFNVSDTGDAVYYTGPEMQLLDNQGHADGGSPLTSAGSNYALHPPRWDVAAPADSWNRSRLMVQGDKVEHWLNGVLIVEYFLDSDDWRRRVQDSKFRGMPDYGSRSRGHVALQDHGEKVSFRNIRIRRLGLEASQ